MELHVGRGIRSLICLAVVLACVSAPVAAQRGIDLLSPEPVLRAGEPPVRSDGAGEALVRSDGGGEVRVTLAGDPAAIREATHSTTYRYDDGDFENFEEGFDCWSPPRRWASGARWSGRSVLC